MSWNKLEGKPVRVKSGAADRMNKALEVLGISPQISQTEKTLTVGKTRVNCPRTYETMKSIDFDNRIQEALRILLIANNFNSTEVYNKQSEINEELRKISPQTQLGTMFYSATSSSIENFLSKAKAVEEFYSREDIKKNIELYEALQELFRNDWDEVIA